jgi:hypothetical protein
VEHMRAAREAQAAQCAMSTATHHLLLLWGSQKDEFWPTKTTKQEAPLFVQPIRHDFTATLPVFGLTRCSPAHGRHVTIS